MFEKIILIKGRKKGMVYLQEISLQRILDCFSWKHRRDYIGVTRNIFLKIDTTGYLLMENFFNFVASKARRWWTPYWLLNLLYLFGNDHSIVRCRNQRLSRWHRNLTNGIQITQVKEKWGTLRVYGSFTQEVQHELDKLEKLIDPMLEAY